MTLARSFLRAAMLAMGLAPSLVSSASLVLRPDVRVETETVTLADLVEGASGAAASRAVFRAPALGEIGTIQIGRIIDAAQALGMVGVDTGGRVQVTVTRAARRISAVEIEAAIKPMLEQRHGLERQATTVVFDGAPAFLVEAQLKTPVSVDDLPFDPRSRRLTATVVVAGSSSGRRGQLRVSGVAVETVDVVVLNRAVARSELIRPEDIGVERRLREGTPADAAAADPASFAGRIARRALAAGTIMRQSDVARPEVVARGDSVLITYNAPGVALTLRGKALEAGALGDTIGVQNLQSKRTLQATIVGAGRVSVSHVLPGRLAENNLPPKALP